MAPRVTIDEARREVYVNGREVNLTNKEFELLKFIKSRPLASRQEIMRAVWDDNLELDTRTVDQHIARLRKKCKLPIIKTVSLHGYKYIGA